MINYEGRLNSTDWPARTWNANTYINHPQRELSTCLWTTETIPNENCPLAFEQWKRRRKKCVATQGAYCEKMQATTTTTTNLFEVSERYFNWMVFPPPPPKYPRSVTLAIMTSFNGVGRSLTTNRGTSLTRDPAIVPVRQLDRTSTLFVCMNRVLLSTGLKAPTN